MTTIVLMPRSPALEKESSARLPSLSFKPRKSPSPSIDLGSSGGSISLGDAGPSAVVLTNRPSRRISAEIDVSTRAIMLSARIFSNGHHLQQREDDTGVEYTLGSKQVVIEFSNVRHIKIEDTSVFTIVMANSSDLVVRCKDGCMSLVYDFAKWISFTQARVLDDIIVMAGDESSDKTSKSPRLDDTSATKPQTLASRLTLSRGFRRGM